MDLEILFTRLDTRDFQVKFSSKTTPRETVSLTRAVALSLITTFKLKEYFFAVV